MNREVHLKRALLHIEKAAEAKESVDLFEEEIAELRDYIATLRKDATRLAPPATELVGDEPRTLRDAFAMATLRGLAGANKIEEFGVFVVAGTCFAMADAMLAERAKAQDAGGAT